MTELDCTVVSDLLPLYAENMLSAETADAVARHLENCPACREKYERAVSGVPVQADTNMEKALPLKRFYLHLILIILGFPIWLPIVLTLLAIIITVYALVWVADILLWCIPLTCGCASLGGIVTAAYSIYSGMGGTALLGVGIALAGAGFAMLSGYLALLATKGIINLSVFLFVKIKDLVTGKKKGERKQ